MEFKPALFRRPTTLRGRLTFWYICVLAALLLVYATVVFAFQYVALTRQLYHDEVQDVVTVEGLLYFAPDRSLQLSQDYFSRPQSHLLIDRLLEVRDLSNQVLYRSPTLHGMALGGSLRPGEGDAGFDERILKLQDGSRAFVVSHIHTMQGRTLVIRLGYDLEPLRLRMEQFLLLLVIAIPLALLLAALAGEAIARRALLPLEQMTARAGLITASNLSERLETGSGEDELGTLARVFNHLLQRLEESFGQLQRFTADASHELRAPLAAIRTISEVALEKPAGTVNYRESISSVLEESARLSETIDALLLLSTAERANAGEAHPPFVLLTLIDEVIGVLEVLGEERGVHILLVDAETAAIEIHADRGLIRVALINVLHNALKFSPNHSEIRVTFFRQSDRTLQIIVQDQGPGIAAGEHVRVFDRFFSSSNPSGQNSKGLGLGLSIAKLILDRAGGAIYFDRAAQQGARCVIQLPRQPGFHG